MLNSKGYGSILRTCLTLILFLACASSAFGQITLPSCSGTLTRFSVCEITLNTSGTYANDYTQVSVTATFTLSGTSTTKTVSGFWDGDNPLDGRGIFKIRFNASNLGTWTYTTSSSEIGLNGRSGSFSVVNGGRGFARRNSSNPEKFVFDNGVRYFMWGQTYYQIVTNARAGSNWKLSVDNSFGYSMNKVRMLLSPFGSYPPYGGSQPFTDSAHQTLDLTHWRKFDEIVDYLRQKPMVADVILFSTNSISYASPIGSAQASDQRYVRYALARLAAFSNVIWCLTNEWQASPYGSSYWDTIGGIIQNEDPWMNQGGNQRPLSIHQSTDKTLTGPHFDFFGSPWPTYAVLQYGTHQTVHPLPDDWGNFSIRNNLGHNMPVANDEYLYLCNLSSCPSGQVFTQMQHRQAMWGIATAGGYGSEGDLRLINGQQPTISADWQDEPEYADVQRMIDFFVNRVSNWWRMSTQNSLVTSGTRVYVLAEGSLRYVVYAAVGGTFTLNLPPPSGATSYRVFRYDPSTGSEVQLSNVGGGSQTFSTPSGSDWVLRIEV